MKAKTKTKAKAKKKRTKFVVVWAEYNRNEHKDALCCSVYGVYDTEEAAHDAIMESISDEALDYVIENDLMNGETSKVPRAIKRCVRDGIWYDHVTCVKFELNNVEYFYQIEQIEV